MRRVEITKQEHEVLKDYLRTSRLILIRSKCQALLMREKGMKLIDIGDIVSRDKRTITRWIKEWCEIRLGSLFSWQKSNENANKLTKEQREEIKKTLSKAPSDYGIPKEFWDVPTLKEYVEAKFDTVYESDRSYHFLLKFSKLSFKNPDTFDRRRNDRKIEERIKEIREEIEPKLKDSVWEVFASDEVRIELEALTRRAWLKRGERTIVKVERKRECQSYLGLLNQKTFRCHSYEMRWQNQEEVIKALKTFLKEYPDKKVCIVWDNASFHKGQQIKEALKKGADLDRVHLISFPPYAPDKNPIESIWNSAKGAIANIQRDTFSETKTMFVNYINGRIFNYQI